MPHDVELILLRQLANYLTMPLFIVGTDERLLFYNEAAGALLGRAYDEAGTISIDGLATMFQTSSEDGAPLGAEELPITIAVRARRPAHARVRFRGLDGVTRVIEVTAFPVDGQAGRHLGAAALFWEVAGE